MDSEQLNLKLYEKMVESQNKMKDWLQSQSFDDMMRGAYEYLVRNDILLHLEFHDLSDVQAFALLETEDPLAAIFEAFTKVEDHHMERVEETIENHANSLIEEKRKRVRETPVYRQTADYAKAHGEIDWYRDSQKYNTMCASAIEDAISLRYDFDKKRLDPVAADEVLQAFGEERTLFVLAANIQDKSWDGRITDDNRKWATQIEIPQDDTAWGTKQYFKYLVHCHPGLLDLFTKQVRKKVEPTQEKKPSIAEKLSNSTPTTPSAKKKKHKEVER